MKKWLVLGTILVLTGVLAIPAFAGNTDVPDWFSQMFDWKKAQVDQMVESGELSQEQGAAFKEHFDYMYNWHQENGFVCPGGGGMGWGMQQGQGPRWMDNSAGNGSQAGFGPGMGRYNGGGPGFGMMSGNNASAPQ